MLLLSYLNSPIIAQSVNKPDGNVIFISLGILFLATILIFLSAKMEVRQVGKKKSFSRQLSIRLKRTGRKGEIQLSIKNRSKEYIEIKAPELIIKDFTSTKRMAVKSNNYPLTISPGTGHSIVFSKKKLNSSNPFQLYKMKIYDNYNHTYQTRYHWF